MEENFAQDDKNMVCPFCDEQLRYGVLVCRGCQADIRYGKKKAASICFLIAAFLGVFLDSAVGHLAATVVLVVFGALGVWFLKDKGAYFERKKLR